MHQCLWLWLGLVWSIRASVLMVVVRACVEVCIRASVLMVVVGACVGHSCISADLLSSPTPSQRGVYLRGLGGCVGRCVMGGEWKGMYA